MEKVYTKLGIPERFHYEEHAGGHELDKSDKGINFLLHYLQASVAPETNERSA